MFTNHERCVGYYVLLVCLNFVYFGWVVLTLGANPFENVLDCHESNINILNITLLGRHRSVSLLNCVMWQEQSLGLCLLFVVRNVWAIKSCLAGVVHSCYETEAWVRSSTTGSSQVFWARPRRIVNKHKIESRYGVANISFIVGCTQCIKRILRRRWGRCWQRRGAIVEFFRLL